MEHPVFTQSAFTFDETQDQMRPFARTSHTRCPDCAKSDTVTVERGGIYWCPVCAWIWTVEYDGSTWNIWFRCHSKESTHANRG